jgi:hypothetical protein
MDTTTGVISLEMDLNWTAADLGLCVLHMADLYNLRLLLEVEREEVRELDRNYPEWAHFRRLHLRARVHPLFPYPIPAPIPLDAAEMTRLVTYIQPDGELRIRKVAYASPGIQDVAGIGTVVRHLKDLIATIIEHVSSRRRRKLEDDRLELQNDAMRIKNAREYVKLAKDCGYSEVEMRRLLAWTDDRQQTFIRLIDAGKIRSVKLLGEDNPPKEVPPTKGKEQK